MTRASPRTASLSLLLLVLLLVVAACAEVTPVPTATPVATAVPTATPVPATAFPLLQLHRLPPLRFQPPSRGRNHAPPPRGVSH